jgi:hypothetical protein
LHQDPDQALGENQTTQQSHLWLSGVNEAFRMIRHRLTVSFQSQNETKIGSNEGLWALIADTGYPREAVIAFPSQAFFVNRAQNEAESAPVIPA